MSDAKIRELVEGEVSVFLSGAALNTDPWDVTVEEAAATWQVLDAIKTACEGKLAELRERLLEEAEAAGTFTHKKGHRLFLEDRVVITRERREGKLPEDEGLRVLLEGKEIPLKEAYTRKMTWVMDPSKLVRLLDLGLLKKKEIEKLKQVSWALKVTRSPLLAALLQGYAPPNEPEEEELAEAEPPARQKRLSATGARKGK